MPSFPDSERLRLLGLTDETPPAYWLDPKEPTAIAEAPPLRHRSSAARPSPDRLTDSQTAHVMHMYDESMPVMLQVRNLPDEVHAKLKERAAAARMSLSDYVATELEKLVRYRTNAEIIAEARKNMPPDGPSREEIVSWIREDRDSR